MSSSFSATVTKLVGSLDANYITSSSDATQLSYTYSADSLDSSSNVTSLSFSSLANEISTSANAVELVVTALEGDFVKVQILADGFSASEVLRFDFSKVASDVFSISESVSFSLSRPLTDSFVATDALFASVAKGFVETITISEQLNFNADKPLSNSASFTDQVSSVASFFRSPDDTFSISESLAISFARDSLSDLFTASDILVMNPQLSKTDSMAFSDSGEIKFQDYATDYFDGSNGNYVESTQTF